MRAFVELKCIISGTKTPPCCPQVMLMLGQDTAVPPLDSIEKVLRNSHQYAGPTDESNWVIPGCLLVGAFPASVDDQQNTALIYNILAQGITTFVCLQQEYVAEGVPEAMWRSGKMLRPYFCDAVGIARKVHQLRHTSSFNGAQVVAAEDLTFIHFPIIDCDVAEDDGVLMLALQLADRLKQGEKIYMHCWGGHGRTGTLVSIILCLLYDITADESMKRCQLVHDLRRIQLDVPSPQTQSQRDQVRRVVLRYRAEEVSALELVTSTALLVLEEEDLDDSNNEYSDCDQDGPAGVNNECFEVAIDIPPPPADQRSLKAPSPVNNHHHHHHHCINNANHLMEVAGRPPSRGQQPMDYHHHQLLNNFIKSNAPPPMMRVADPA